MDAGGLGFFGGAICRIAAVQFARNERIPLKEAILFAKERFASYFASPVFPLLLVALFTFFLMIFGWIEWIPWVGDVFAGIFWPIVLFFGFIIAIVLVGLVGWPLMIATISTEGTDSFDALSRSYSYVYQAPGATSGLASWRALRGGARLLRRLHGVADGLHGRMGGLQRRWPGKFQP